MQEKLIADKIENSKELTEEEVSLRDELVKCLNFVQNEIATEFIPLTKIENVESQNGEFSLSSLSEKIAYIISLKDENGTCVKYKIHGDKLVFEGKALLTYCYCPKKVFFDGECEVILPERVFASGVLREYYLLQGLSSEASMFEEKFKNSLKNFARKKSEIVMPNRAWK